MKKVTKGLFCMLVSGVIVLSGTACGGGGGGFHGGGGGSKNTFRIGIEENSNERTMAEKLITGFKAANPDITLDFKIESYSGNYSDKLIAQASNGALPDVFFTLDSLVGYFASKRITVDVSRYFDEYNFSADSIYEDVLSVGKVGEEVHMLGREYSQVVLYYNKDIFDDAEVSYPTEEWTWDDMIAAGRKLVKKDAQGVVTQMGIDMKLNWPVTMLQYFAGNGGWVFNQEGTAGALDEKTRTAYVELRDLVKEGVILNTYGNTGLSFTGGNVGMYFGVRADAPTVNKQLDSWDVVHVPDLPTPAVGLGASGYSVSALGSHKDVAIKFLFYIVSEEGQQLLAETGSVVPVLKSLSSETADWTKYPAEGINFRAFLPEENTKKVFPISTYMSNPSKSNKIIDALNDVTSKVLSSSGEIGSSVWNGYETSLTTALR